MYRGRFAPSPTGQLHLGSLITAIASYAEAQKQKGEWLVRIEDLDPPREVKGATKEIIKCLENAGFQFDTPKLQSDEAFQARYQIALNELIEKDTVYYCTCSRKQLHQLKLEGKPHICRNNTTIPSGAYSIKYRVTPRFIEFQDTIQGKLEFELNEFDDFVIFRKEGWFSYQLAVVIDDHNQQINQIIRGIDLIDSTPLQLMLIKSLGLTPPGYTHLPILVNPEGQKLSKQTYAKEVDTNNPLTEMIQAYSYLNQTPFTKPPQNIQQFWSHVLSSWDLDKVPKLKSITIHSNM